MGRRLFQESFPRKRCNGSSALPPLDRVGSVSCSPCRASVRRACSTVSPMSSGVTRSRYPARSRAGLAASILHVANRCERAAGMLRSAPPRTRPARACRCANGRFGKRQFRIGKNVPQCGIGGWCVAAKFLVMRNGFPYCDNAMLSRCLIRTTSLVLYKTHVFHFSCNRNTLDPNETPLLPPFTEPPRKPP